MIVSSSSQFGDYPPLPLGPEPVWIVAAAAVCICNSKGEKTESLVPGTKQVSSDRASGVSRALDYAMVQYSYVM